MMRIKLYFGGPHRKKKTTSAFCESAYTVCRRCRGSRVKRGDLITYVLKWISLTAVACLVRVHPDTESRHDGNVLTVYSMELVINSGVVQVLWK